MNLTPGQPNKNGVIYDEKGLERAIKKYTKDYIEPDRALGELGQPKDVGVNLTNVAFKVNGIEKQDDTYVGEIEILETPNGDQLRKLIDDGNYRLVTMVFGNVTQLEEDKNIKVVDDFEITVIGIEPKDNCA